MLFRSRSGSESYSSASDSELRQLYRSSSSPSSTSTSSGPDGPTPCKDGCCRTINVLSKQEELLLDLIEAIEDPGIKAQKLTLFHQALVKETTKPPIKIQQPKVDLEQIYSRFTQSKKEVTVNDLQKQMKESQPIPLISLSNLSLCEAQPLGKPNPSRKLP